MITFKQYLQEARYRTDISNERAIDLLKDHCSDALKNIDTPLIRGTKTSTEQAYLVHGELGDGRSSAWSDSNFYTVILDEVNGPAGYPLRSKSVIMSNWAGFHNIVSYARGKGGVYAMFPYDGVKIGVCPSYDMWEGPAFTIGESKRRRTINDWNDWFLYMNLDESSYEALVHSIEDTLEDPERAAKETGKPEGFFDELVETFDPGKVDEQLHKAYSASNQEFDLVDTRTVYDISNERECWTSGKCVAIRLGLTKADAHATIANLKEMLK